MTIQPKSQNIALVGESFERRPRVDRVDWLKVDPEERTIVVKETPTSESLPLDVSLQRVVEYYSR